MSLKFTRLGMYVCLLFLPFSHYLSRIHSHFFKFRSVPCTHFLRASAPLHKRNERRVSIDFLYLYVTSYLIRWTRSTTLNLSFIIPRENCVCLFAANTSFAYIHLVDLAVCLSYVRFSFHSHCIRASVKSLRILPPFHFFFLYARTVHRQFCPAISTSRWTL